MVTTRKRQRRKTTPKRRRPLKKAARRRRKPKASTPTLTEPIALPGDAAAIAAGCYYDQAAAEHVREFFRRFLRHSKGQWAGLPFEVLPWQWLRILSPLFGWRRPDGTRRYRRAYIQIGKKNGKSTLMAGVALYMLIADGEPAAEVYSAAGDHSQAGIVYGEAERMIRKSPSLRNRCLITPSQKHIAFVPTESIYKALSADAPTKEGLNAHCIVFDELHTQPNRQLWDALFYAGASRRQPLLIAITTAGWDRNSICYEQYDYACKVRDGIIEDTSFLPCIYEAGPDDDWTAPATWLKGNPSLGVTLSEESLAHACTEARESPNRENTFKRYRLDMWTQQDVRFLTMESWDACNGAAPPADLAKAPCWGGLDLATTTDIAAFVLVFNTPDGWAVVPYFWAPAESAEIRERRDRVPYRTWAGEGLIEMTPGNVIDYAAIRRRVNELGDLYSMRTIAVDPWNATQLAGELMADGFELVEFRQGFKSMNSPTKELEKLVLSKRILHGGNPVMRWMASNAAVETDAAGNLKPSKARSTERIDGIVALIMALGVATAAGQKGPSVYESKGIEVV
ncbi:MAG TPA: terminase TerL endonuclease subunit [Phycisphaerae bacterium]|nr:terminase TerL endonuclease subunit [Phycisphaerae bacterium]